MASFDPTSVRLRFPALARLESGQQVAYLDGPGGTQVPLEVIEAMSGYLAKGNSNLGGAFTSSAEASEVEDRARRAVADLIGSEPDEVVFGQNMTSLTFAVSRSLAREWSSDDTVVVTSLDHDANVSPWIAAAADRGASIRQVAIDPADATLDLASLEEALALRPRVLAVTAASNAVGTLTPLDRIIPMAHAAGALVYVDAVHYSAHRLSAVRRLDADFVVASAYKFFGPHTGVLYGKREHLERLKAYKVTPAPDHGPGKWETGTQSFESLTGVAAAVDYLASLGEGSDRRARLLEAFERIRVHEEDLALRFLRGLSELPGVHAYGITAPDRVAERVPTFALAVDRTPPRVVAERLGSQGIAVWDGHYYAIAVMKSLGVLDRGGLVRIGFVHYNTAGEVDRVLGALEEIAG
jgi:cysteine desulfurase family protein (TIGR01976 family)